MRFGGCRHIPLCLALTFALVLGGPFGFILTNRRGGSSGPSTGQLGVVFPGIFERFLKLRRIWKVTEGRQNLEKVGECKDTDNRSWRSGWPASRQWEGPLNNRLRPSRPNFCPSQCWAGASCRRRLDS